MYKRALMVGAALWLAAGMAHASDKLAFGPAPDWVKPVTLAPGPAREASLLPVAMINRSLQANLSDAGDTMYSETAIVIQSPLGLAAGQPTIIWNPATDTVTVHKAKIIRGAQVIDLLAQGQKFFILRREKDLEQSMIDGKLTAVLQTEGLEVGDILVFAMSVTHRMAALKGKSEGRWTLLDGEGISRLDYRIRWPATKPIKWVASEDLPAPVITQGPDGTELNFNLASYRRQATPDHAPARFAQTGQVAYSEFPTWTEASATMAPVFLKAAQLSPNSPIHDEVARIRAFSADPKVQAAAALRLVEEKVRYMYVAANEGGYYPQTADETWLKRYGDCKAKTVLLLAILSELGIEAEPALVDTEGGDAVGSDLPRLGPFDHVIVRATIGGKTYWMDGTRYGDGVIERLPVPGYHWALPLTAKGTDLERMVVPPLDLPAKDIDLRLDASGGFDAPAPAHVEVTVRGDKAIAAGVAWATVLPDELQDNLKARWHALYPWIDAEKMSVEYKPEIQELTLVMDGKAKMYWTPARPGRGRRYETDGYDLGIAVMDEKERPDALDRDGVPHADAPVVITHPLFQRAHETIVLPDAGKGYAVIGTPVDRTLYGLEMKRSLEIRDGVFTLTATTRSLTDELPYADAKAAESELADISSTKVLLEAPQTSPDVALNSGGAAEGQNASGVTKPVVAAADETASPGDDDTRKPAPKVDTPKASPRSFEDNAKLFSGYNWN
ncbi:DUF3857 domain-containing protein [Asticcacaulis solisilvae]|uniref:DUF3857 domain-containing protein n=1 Tax=Asticcacaulis solisilvae TaxID=1217274 RepID=UPI003FD78019